MNNIMTFYRKENLLTSFNNEAPKVTINLNNVKYLEQYLDKFIFYFIDGTFKSFLFDEWDVKYS